MYGFVSHLMIMAMVAHALLGCCWHHGHACSSEAASIEVTRACHVDSCGHDHHEGHEPADGDHPDRHGCQDGGCVFVTDRPTRTVTAPATPVDREAVATLYVGLPGREDLRPNSLALSVRLPTSPTYLLNQVLLL